MKLNKQQETEILLVYNSYWDNYIKGNVEAMQSLLDNDYTQIGSAEGEVFFNKKDAVQFVYDTIDQVAGKRQMRNRKTKLEQQDNFILIHELCDLFALSDEEWIFYSKFRASTLMQEKKDGWKISHQHSSFPDTKAEEGQNIAIDKIAEENIQLREAVKRRTVELEQKNRELEIEAALERVRSRTLMMKESKELNEAVAVFFQQFQTLNLLPTEARTYFCHINPLTAIAEVWMTHADGTVMETSHQTPLRNSPSMLNYFEAWQRKEPILVRSYSGETLKEYLQFVSSLPHAKADKDYQKLFSSPPEKIVMTDANFLQGNIGIMTFQPLSQEASDILIRFARVFEFTYIRFLDLQKAEAQAREAQIEAALEKVRSRSLAMHKSDELKDVVAVLFQKLQELEFGIDKGAALVMTYQSDSKDHTQWITDATQTYAVPFFIPFSNHTIARDQFNARKKGLAFQSKLYDQKEKNEYFKYLFQHTEYKNIPKAVQELILSSKSFGISIAFEKNSAIAIPSTVGKLVSGDEINILKRFAKVFEQSYTRFLDLQKAEAQAREAQIEAALEKIRSRSLAMHSSKELKDVIATMIEKLEELKVIHGTLAIQLFDFVTMNSIFWPGNNLQEEAPKVQLPFDQKMMEEDTCHRDLWKAKENGEPIFNKVYTRQQKDRWFEYVFAHNDSTVIEERAREYIRIGEVHTVCFFPEKNAALFADSWDGSKYSEDEFMVLKRVAKVFDQAYTRFLDLQKSEEQAREAQIEAALERVRSRTMAMHNSSELIETAELLFDQLNQLGAESQGVAFAICDKESIMVEKWTSIGVFSVPYTFEAGEQRMYEAWKNQTEIYEEVYEGERLRKYYELFMEIPEFKQGIQKFIDSGYSLPEWQKNHAVPFKYGYLLLITSKPFEKTYIFTRFAKVFEQTYTRFLDLQKAEAQAREAQIEAALERVRSRTMGMQRSEELQDTALLLFQQIEGLGLPPFACGFNIWDEDRKAATAWMGSVGGLQPPFKTDSSRDVYLPIYEAAQRGESLFVIEQSGKELEVHYDYLATIPTFRDIIMAGWKRDGISVPKFQIIHCAYFTQGYLMFISFEPVPSYYDIFKRFAKVFEQTYTRFLDLQKAEAQAREARIEAALERVRAKAMAMHSSKDIETATAVVFNELTRLGIVMERCGIVILNETQVGELWSTPLSPKNKEVVKVITGQLDFRIHPMGQQFYQDWEEKKDFSSYKLVGDEVRNYYDILEKQPDYQFPKIASYPDQQFGNIFFFRQGGIFAFKNDELSVEAKKILQRFAKVFEQTYTRFLDIQRAEALTREAQIETALERVRAKAMAMHGSKDISDATAVVFNELSKLGVEMERCGILNLNETPVMEVWSTPLSPKNKQVIDVIYGYLDISIHPLLQGIYKTWTGKKDFYTYELEGEEVKKYYDLLEKAPEYRFPKIARYKKRQVIHVFYFNEGGLFVYTKNKMSDETKQIFQRFTRVFSLTYRRYLDIVKAEAQAREAQIEASLERVRAKAMAMHSSKDIETATAVVFNELTRLGINMERCGIALINETPIFEVWSTPLSAKNKEVVNVVTGHVDSRTHPMNQQVHQNWQEKKDYSYYKLVGDEVRKYYDKLEKQPGYQFPKIARYPDHQISYCFFFNEGGIFVFANDELKAEEKIIFKRFAKVFEQTYTRFLDLQKAEAQAREAQIEAALERVRAKAMAMHSSNDISDATVVVFNELGILGLEMERCGIVILDETPIMEVWSTPLSPENKQVIEVITGNLDSNIHPMLQELYNAWKDKQNFFTYKLTGDEVQKYYAKLEKAPGYKFPKISQYPNQQVASCFFFNEGNIFVYTKADLSEESKNILHRFTKVFSLTYRRYIELINAEKQAREAKIEAALERVRSKAMAMHNSEDFNATIGAFYRELEQFSITPRRCGVGLLQKNRVAELSTMNTTEHGNSIEIIGKLKMEKHWVLDGVFDNWCLQKEYHPVLRGNEIKEYNQILRPQVAFPEYPNDSVQFGYFFFFPEGGVYAWTEKEMTEDELKLYRRFTNVLSLTYKRYKDLKDAETNAREAVRRASLDRVRAEIASMRSVDDLQRITPIIWHELTTLGVPFVRCGVFIINEATAHVQVFLSSPDGKSLAALNLSFDSSELTSNTVNHWRKGIIFKTHWNKQEFLNFMQSMIKLGQVSNQKTYQGTAAPPESLHLHFVPFKQGMLYVGNTAPLEKEALELVKALAESFSIAYARYEDFRQLEEAKNQIEKTFTELKAAQTQLIQAEKMASLGELTAGIAHEIQNPLNFVNNFSEISSELIAEMKEELVTGNLQLAIGLVDDISQNLEKINHHGKRAADIVKGMLQHSRTSSGQKELTDINALADEYLRLAYHGLRAKDKSFNAKMNTDFDVTIGKINIIPQDIGRVILNLITNAFYVVDEKKKLLKDGYEPVVSVSTKMMNNHISISVKDNGNGIPKHILDKIFQPFFTTKPTGQGTGLGLSLAYDIVKAHGGELKVETKQSEGSEFIIQLPIN